VKEKCFRHGYASVKALHQQGDGERRKIDTEKEETSKKKKKNKKKETQKKKTPGHKHTSPTDRRSSRPYGLRMRSKGTDLALTCWGRKGQLNRYRRKLAVAGRRRSGLSYGRAGRSGRPSNNEGKGMSCEREISMLKQLCASPEKTDWNVDENGRAHPERRCSGEGRAARYSGQEVKLRATYEWCSQGFPVYAAMTLAARQKKESGGHFGEVRWQRFRQR